MTAHPMTQPYTAAAETRTAAIAAHEYVRPIVRCVASPSAHSSSTPRRFSGLQRRMVAAERAARAGAERAIVVVPSRTIDKWHEPPAEAQAYEERMLCALLELRDPSTRMTYVTSSPIAPATIDYYLSLLPRRMRRHARSRLTLVALGERSARPLSEKLIERPDVIARIGRAASGGRPCHLLPYNTTSLERDLALALDMPVYGADPRHGHFGTKSGCRRLFARAGVPHPAGVEGVTGAGAAVAAIVSLRAARTGVTRVVLKLNDGVSGEGNAIIELAGLPDPGSPDERERVARRVATLTPEAPGVSAAAFLGKLEQRGGVAEEWIAAPELHSPSVQLEITPSGEVRLLSTHDQILGGAGGQSYLGCRFPAAPSYAPMISAHARRVADHLARAGVIGRFAIDFVVARAPDGGWQAFAIELNLRRGGTTHPYETLEHLTGGSYDADSATFTTPGGQPRHYVATDHLEADGLRELGAAGVLALARRGGLGFDRIQRTGTVFHMLSSLDELGRTGFTAIAASAGQADALYDRVRDALLAHAEAASATAARRASLAA